MRQEGRDNMSQQEEDGLKGDFTNPMRGLQEIKAASVDPHLLQPQHTLRILLIQQANPAEYNEMLLT